MERIAQTDAGASHKAQPHGSAAVRGHIGYLCPECPPARLVRMRFDLIFYSIAWMILVRTMFNPSL
jgi:hypothetical protein